MITASQLITQNNLKPHPEGGYYSESYRSGEIISANALPGRYKGDRCFSTAIYFLLEGEQFSGFHRIQSDELWHFYTGIGLHIYLLHDDGRGEILKLGNDLAEGYCFQQLVPASCWFASKPATHDGFSFMGCTVAPGFEFADFEMADKETLMKEFPQHKEWITRLTL